MTETISKSKLKAKMLEVFRRIEADGTEVIVTDHGKAVIKISAIKDKVAVTAMFGDLQGQVKYLEDINTPTLHEWEDA